MNLQSILNNLTGPSTESSATAASGGGFGETLSKLTSHIPGGLAGGAVAGGLMALLVSNKSARKVAGKAATYGGAALLGGMAFKAFQNWKSQSAASSTATAQQHVDVTEPRPQQFFATTEQDQIAFELTLTRAMIGAAKCDGHIDSTEQQRIFHAVEQMQLTAAEKGMVFEWLNQDIAIEDLATAVDSLEMKAEIYLASCLVIDADEPAEQAYLQQLACVMDLPEELTKQLQLQAIQARS